MTPHLPVALRVQREDSRIFVPADRGLKTVRIEEAGSGLASLYVRPDLQPNL